MGGIPPDASVSGPASNMGHSRSHSRCHSRNLSITSSLSAGSLNQQSALTSGNILTTFAFPVVTNPPPSAASKRNSHHRRHSSVSTRTESAELMGVSLPELPSSNSDNNMNLGDRDSIRRRALLALEGKPDISFSKVEIPEIGTPDPERSSFDFCMCLPSLKYSRMIHYLHLSIAQASIPLGSGGSPGSSLVSMLGNKRDSFKLLAASSSSKDQLHTLVEEEEEEEEEVTLVGHGHENVVPSVAICEGASEEQDTNAVSEVVIEANVSRSIPIRPRPVALNLRPLSLTPENLSSFQGLPTPTITPQPFHPLRRLSLSSASGEEVPSSSASMPTPASRRLQLTLQLGGNQERASEDLYPRRRSSITYKPSSHGVATNYADLPTPEMTPTFRDRLCPNTEPVYGSKSDEKFPGGSENRPLSASEQHFLVKSHNALLLRITDLEQALTNQQRVSFGYTRSDIRQSRPTSILSEISDISSEPSDEMLKLIAELKAERDELKRDVDGWRNRVGDMEKQMTMLAKRLENERRDAWFARSQGGILEVEKRTLEKKLEEMEKAVGELNARNLALTTAREASARENQDIKLKMQELEEQIKIARLELQSERDLRTLQDNECSATPIVPPLSSRPKSSYGRNTTFASIDSLESSATEVEISADDCEARFSFMLKVVQEQEESVEFENGSEDGSGLVGYEDEEDSDASFRSSSSFGSVDDPIENSVQPATPSTPKSHIVSFSPLSSSSTHHPIHHSSESWSKSWAFPRATNLSTLPKYNKKDSIDHFFGCVDDGSSSEGDSASCSPSQYSFEKRKSLFMNALKEAGEDNSPFFLPQGVGFTAEDKNLGVMFEEKEEKENEETAEDVESDEDMFGEMGGITITLSPPEPEDGEPVIDLPQLMISRPIEKPPQLPMLNFDDDDDTGFSFGRALEDSHSNKKGEEEDEANMPSAGVASVASPSTVTQSPPLPISRTRSILPSAIPRLSAMKSAPFTKTMPIDVDVMPPSRRDNITPSLIPQAVSSPSPIRIAPVSGHNKLTGTSTSISQPQKKPLMNAVDGNVFQSGTNPNGSNHTFQTVICTC